MMLGSNRNLQIHMTSFVFLRQKELEKLKVMTLGLQKLVH